MKKYRITVLINLGIMFLVLALIAYMHLIDKPASALFLHPVSPNYPGERILTYTFQILCSIPFIVCTFTWGVLRTIQAKGKLILLSAIMFGIFFINEIFRIHIMLSNAGIPEVFPIGLYAIFFTFCGLLCRK